MSLKILTEQQIKDTFLYRWPRVCINPDIWNLSRQVKDNLFRRWKEVKFEKANASQLNSVQGQQGIYMFVAKPHNQHNIHHSYILYVGEASDLKTRFENYFRYRTTTNPSDQLKRRMVIVWKDYLYFYYIKTFFDSTKERERQEYDLIDTIVPPINDKFRSKIVKSYTKSLRGV